MKDQTTCEDPKLTSLARAIIARIVNRGLRRHDLDKVTLKQDPDVEQKRLALNNNIAAYLDCLIMLRALDDSPQSSPQELLARTKGVNFEKILDELIDTGEGSVAKNMARLTAMLYGEQN